MASVNRGAHGRRLGGAIATVGRLVALVVGRSPGLFGSTWPPSAAEGFSTREWQVLAHPDDATGPFDEPRLERVGLVGKPGGIPLDPQLSKRVTFVGLEVTRLEALPGPAAPPWIPNQPLGGVGYRMHPPVDRCHTIALIPTVEPDRGQVPVVVCERLEESSHRVEEWCAT